MTRQPMTMTTDIPDNMTIVIPLPDAFDELMRRIGLEAPDIALNGDDLSMTTVLMAQLYKRFRHFRRWQPDGFSRLVKPHRNLMGTEVATWAYPGDEAPVPGLLSSCRLGDDWGAIISVELSDGNRCLGSISVWADSSARADKILKGLRLKLDGELPMGKEEDRSHLVPFYFWRATNMGPKPSYRDIVVPHWSEISDNYDTEVQSRFAELHKIEHPDPNGPRIILLHGPAGTGKTTMIRSLAHAWKDWSTFHCIVDPENLWGDPNYLFELAMGDHYNGPGGARVPWRVLVMEDSGELLCAREGGVTGQSLARLLNMADGILGQGMRVMFLITSNERIQQLHPAVSRPGRCLAKIEVDKLPAEQASKWLGKDVASPHSLAELYALKTETELRGHTVEEAETAIGHYL